MVAAMPARVGARGTVEFRETTVADARAILGFLRGLSVDTRAKRFLSAAVDLEGEARRLAALGGQDEGSVIATVGESPAIAAHGCFARTGADRAEVAVVVADALQGRGVGTAILRRLATLARSRGIETFEAEVSRDNERVIAWVRRSFPAEIRRTPGSIQLEIPITLPPSTSPPPRPTAPLR